MKAIIVLLLLCTRIAHADPHRSLLLVGGGDLPDAAVSRFVDAAGGREARILVVTWATQDPQGAFERARGEFSPFLDPSRVTEAPRAPLDPDSKRGLERELGRATAVFFTGGDQNRIMDELAEVWIRDRMRALFAAGMPFGGTSAGTAIMSPWMFSGRGSELVPGLGLLPGSLLDTHFLKRKREARLFDALGAHPDLHGIGIDEDTAIWVTNRAEVIGPSKVMTARPVEGQGIQSELHAQGEHFPVD